MLVTERYQVIVSQDFSLLGCSSVFKGVGSPAALSDHKVGIRTELSTDPTRGGISLHCSRGSGQNVCRSMEHLTVDIPSGRPALTKLGPHRNERAKREVGSSFHTSNHIT